MRIKPVDSSDFDSEVEEEDDDNGPADFGRYDTGSMYQH